MKIRRFIQLRYRTLLVLVALLAFLLWGVSSYWRVRQYNKWADAYAKLGSAFEEDADISKAELTRLRTRIAELNGESRSKPLAEPEASQLHALERNLQTQQRCIELATGLAEHFGHLATKYKRAAERPWLRMAPVPNDSLKWAEQSELHQLEANLMRSGLDQIEANLTGSGLDDSPAPPSLYDSQRPE
jgi:hypothetical protein